MRFFKLFPLILLVAAGFLFLFQLSDLLSPSKTSKAIPIGEWCYKPENCKSFVFIIFSRNNEKYCEKNIQSIFEQTYSNYRIIYINDGSTDGTLQKVDALISLQNKKEKCTLISNTTSLGKVANWHRAIHLCSDEEIVVLLDGHDWLSHDQVLLWLNSCYDDSRVWMTYGSACEFPSYKRPKTRREIPQRVHKRHSYRALSKKIFLISHLKTAYAGLLKKIKLEDLQMNGEFLPAAAEEAFMLPAIEMAKEHAHFIRDILCIFNRKEVAYDDLRPDLLQHCKQYICSLSPYSPIESERDFLREGR